jgi:hypothetical protein
MPNRILRANIITSERMAALSWPAKWFFIGLITQADDHGRFDGRPAILRSSIYPLELNRVSEPDVRKWLTECVSAGVVRQYTVEDKPYVLIRDFGQQVRSASKWPDPPADDPPSSARSCAQVRAVAHVGGGVCEGAGVTPPKAPQGGRCVTVLESPPQVPKPQGRPADIAEAEAFGREIGLPAAQVAEFFDHFTANGWKQGGRAPMKDWRAAMRNWHRRWAAGVFRAGSKPPAQAETLGLAQVRAKLPYRPPADDGKLAEIFAADLAAKKQRAATIPIVHLQ